MFFFIVFVLGVCALAGDRMTSRMAVRYSAVGYMILVFISAFFCCLHYFRVNLSYWVMLNVEYWMLIHHFQIRNYPIYNIESSTNINNRLATCNIINIGRIILTCLHIAPVQRAA
jgi:hypothetical protein